MGLNINGLVLRGMDLAFRLTPDVQKTVAYHRVKGSAYDAETGTVTANQTIATDIAAIVTSYSEVEQGEDAQFGDELVIIRFKDLMLQGIASVDVDDVIVENDGPARQVVEVLTLDTTRQVLKLRTKRRVGLDVEPIHGEDDEVEGESGIPLFG
jgi:hypothetical protein